MCLTKGLKNQVSYLVRMLRSNTLVWIKRLNMHSNSTSRSSMAILTPANLLFALWITMASSEQCTLTRTNFDLNDLFPDFESNQGEETRDKSDSTMEMLVTLTSLSTSTTNTSFCSFIGLTVLSLFMPFFNHFKHFNVSFFSFFLYLLHAVIFSSIPSSPMLALRRVNWSSWRCSFTCKRRSFEIPHTSNILSDDSDTSSTHFSSLSCTKPCRTNGEWRRLFAELCKSFRATKSRGAITREEEIKGATENQKLERKLILFVYRVKAMVYRFS